MPNKRFGLHLFNAKQNNEKEADIAEVKYGDVPTEQLAV